MRRIGVLAAVVWAIAWLLAPQASAQSPESVAWVRAQQSCEGLRAYVRDYPGGRFIDRARQELPVRCPAAVQKKPPERRTVVTEPPNVDRCVQARADWAVIQNTADVAVLRAFRDSAPAACAVQRAQAQSRIEAVEAERAKLAAAAEEKRRLWNGAPEFEGSWVLQSGSGCGGFPWRFEAGAEGILASAGSATDLLRVDSISPPRLVHERNWARNAFDADTVFTFQRDGTVLARNSAFNCTLRRQ